MPLSASGVQDLVKIDGLMNAEKYSQVKDNDPQTHALPYMLYSYL